MQITSRRPFAVDIRKGTSHRSDVPAESKRYGLGFWLGQHSDSVILEGFDAGVSFRSVHDPRSGLTCTVISNSSDGAWPIARRLDEFLTG